MKSLKILVLSSALSLLLNAHSKAADLVLNQVVPDLTGSYLSVSYYTSSNFFQAIGYTTQYTDKQTNYISVDAYALDYSLQAYITSSGVLTNGSLTIKGDPNSSFGYDTNLLLAKLITGTNGIAFGYGDGGNQIFQFRFDVTGGILASAFGGIGSEGGIILDAQFGTIIQGDHPFTGLWNSGFNNNGTLNGNMDSFAVPEPSSILLILLGGIPLVLAYRRRQKNFNGQPV